jgi:hypothetical protein
MEDFSAYNSFPILTQVSRSVTTDAFLQRDADGYRVLFLGKNGEPQVNKQIDVKLTHRYLNSNSQVLTTNESGQIKLGPLEDINKIQVGSQALAVGANFKLPDYYQDSASTWFHQSELSLLEGDRFDLPISMRKDETRL